MFQLVPRQQAYAWGSVTAIPELLGLEPTGDPLAELWLGAHAGTPSSVLTDGGPRPLDGVIAESPEDHLGRDVVARFGQALPYLLKIIAAAAPLSLQVHPNLERARSRFAEEGAAGLDVTDPTRNYKDANHKPELVLALTRFEAMAGFRAPRRAAELLEGLDAPLARRLVVTLRQAPTSEGIREAFRALLEPEHRPDAREIAELVDACARRLDEGSPSRRSDSIVVRLAEQYPGDPGVVTSLLLNPVTLMPGEAMFVPAGAVHAYLEGTAIEVMANSDNVLRAGLTAKHVDIPELLENVDYVAAPPIRIAPEIFHGATKVFYAPVDDFELSLTVIEDDLEHPLPGRGPRILLCLDGEVDVVTAAGQTRRVARGDAVFASAVDGALCLRGRGTVVQADVP